MDRTIAALGDIIAVKNSVALVSSPPITFFNGILVIREATRLVSTNVSENSWPHNVVTYPFCLPLDNDGVHEETLKILENY